MLERQEKISFRQALFLYFIMVFSPAVRFFPSQTARMAKQAGWLAPVVSFAFLALLVFIFHSFFKSGRYRSYMDVIYGITGKFAGSAILTLNILWLTMLLALYVRYYANRISLVFPPTTRISFFIIVMLALITFVLRYGIVVVARMNEVIFLLILISFGVIFLFSIPQLHVENLTPLSYLDIVPVIKASYYITGVWVYFITIFFFGDKINDKEKIKRSGMYGALFLMINSIMLLILVLGIVKHSIAERSPLPFFLAIKNINIFGFLERIEALSVTQWILSDFIIITVFAYVVLSMLKYLLRLSGTKSFVGVLMLFTYIFSLYIAGSHFELEEFSSAVAIHGNNILLFLLPVFLFLIGKIRKKI
jgi:spore germination protein KB